MKLYDAAVAHYFDAIKIYKKDEKQKYPDLALCYSNLAGTYVLNRQPGKAIVFFNKSK